MLIMRSFCVWDHFYELVANELGTVTPVCVSAQY